MDKLQLTDAFLAFRTLYLWRSGPAAILHERCDSNLVHSVGTLYWHRNSKQTWHTVLASVLETNLAHCIGIWIIETCDSNLVWEVRGHQVFTEIKHTLHMWVDQACARIVMSSNTYDKVQPVYNHPSC